MPRKLTSWVAGIAGLAGCVTFFIFRDSAQLWLLLLAFSPFTLLLPQSRASTRSWLRTCSLMAAGLLIWPMRLFYWDRGDFSLRIRNLLLLILLFSLYLLARQGRWFKKFLIYFNARSLKKRLLAIFVAAELLFILAAAVLTQKGVAIAGDEPHYLAISQSLARDGDLNVFNQYVRGGFKEFLKVQKLAAHGTWGKGFKKIYSYHLPGISLTLVPFFFFKLSPPLLYFLLRSYLGLFGALLAALIYLFCIRLWHSRSLAFFATLIFSLTAPVFFYSLHIFPEVQAMLLVLGALYLLLFKADTGRSHALWAGLLLGSTIFWGVKYALFIYPLTLGFSGYWLWKKNYRPALLLIVFPLFFQAMFFYYLYNAYGNFSPNSVYYGMLSPEQAGAFYETILKRITLKMRWETLLDYFFDQRDGLLLYNPLYFFAFPGLLLAMKKIKRYRYHLLIALPAAFFIINHAFSTIRPGYCPQARYLTPITWALLLFALIYYRESRNRFFKKAFLILPLYALFVTAYQTLAPFTLYQPTTHDTLVRTGLMFQQRSSTLIDLPSLLPSFIKTDNQGYLPNTIFLILFMLLTMFALLGWRDRRCTEILSRSRGFALTLAFLAIFCLLSLFPRLDWNDPRRLIGPRGFPCQIYFNPNPEPGGVTESLQSGAQWDHSGKHCRLRVATMVALKQIEIGIKNRSDRAPLEMRAALFDDEAARWQLQPGAFNVVLLNQPRFKKIKARYNYQFELQVGSNSPGNIPQWALGLILH